MFGIIGFLVFLYALACVASGLNLTSFEFSEDFFGYTLDIASNQKEPVYITLSKK